MSTPMDWQPSKAIQAKTGATQKTIPRWVENLKGRSRQKWDDENKNEKEINEKTNMQEALTTDAMTKAFMWLFQQAAIPFRPSFSTILRFPAFNNGLDVSSNDGIPRRGTFENICQSTSHYVPNIPNVLSVAEKLCLQIANHHASQSIHTCIVMHPMCSCIW